ncbi:GTPase activity protein [Tritrichomonas musculus]|uniref:GTPase activity protein n=1 Tax=Tritrichomonas musculus TaxID=1915356 RepID=A0ABR2K497_9EUKA
MANRSCKLVVLGDSGVGKTTLIHKYVNNEFRADFKSTIGADFTAKEIVVENNYKIDLQIWDTAGEIRFHSVGAAFYRGTDACIIVYDVTSRESFNRIKMWQDDLYTKSGVDDTANFPLIVFGNKKDLDDKREVTYEEASQWSKANRIPVLEVSAKSGENIEVGFQNIIKIFMEIQNEKNKMQEPISIKLTADKEGERSCC